MTINERNSFKKLFTSIASAIRINSLFYDYKSACLLVFNKGTIHFADRLDNDYNLIIERPYPADKSEIELRLIRCNDDCSLENEIFYRYLSSSIGYAEIRQIFLNYLSDFFSGLYHGYNIGRL